MNEQKRNPWGFWLIVLGLALLLGYVGLNPLLESRLATMQAESGTHFLEDVDVYQRARMRGIEVIVAVWVFALGSCIGSYLNVLVYRMPLGKSVMWERSHCPSCQQQIAGKDNIPILGWLQLNGRCRSCNLPISSRYPLVEAFTGFLFLILFLVELHSGGTNLPGRTLPHHHYSFERILMLIQGDLIGLYLFHCFLLTTVLTWSLIQYDQHRVPRYSVISAILLATGLTAIWPDLQVAPLLVLQESWNNPRAVSLTSSLLGGLFGLQIGFLLLQARKLVCNNGSAEQSHTGLRHDRPTSSLILTGCVLGWQGVFSSSILAVGLRQVRLLVLPNNSKWRRWPRSGDLLIAIVIHLTFWRWLSENGSPWWPGSQTDAASMALLAIIFSFLVVTSQHNEHDQRLLPMESELLAETQPAETQADPTNESTTDSITDSRTNPS